MTMPEQQDRLTAFALNCTLKSGDSEEESSTDRLIRDMLRAMEPHGVSGEVVRAADHAIPPGVRSDEGEGDDWPALRRRVLAADIFILGTPIWLGQPSSVAKRVLERMDAFLSETDDRQRMPAAGKVAVVAVVGNEDGAHHCHAATFQALNDVGFTIPANGGAYWVGEAMQAVNYVDLDGIPEKVQATLDMLASNAAHLARVLKAQRYPGLPSGSGG
jgi:multimeric flavodoxin WrbA